tara:strand:- start:8939 stop:9478 length:540 start_codon:yes stop_codon:yes gene_type:complete
MSSNTCRTHNDDSTHRLYQARQRLARAENVQAETNEIASRTVWQAIRFNVIAGGIGLLLALLGVAVIVIRGFQNEYLFFAFVIFLIVSFNGVGIAERLDRRKVEIGNIDRRAVYVADLRMNVARAEDVVAEREAEAQARAQAPFASDYLRRLANTAFPEELEDVEQAMDLMKDLEARLR